MELSYSGQWDPETVLEADIGGEDRRQIIVPRNRREEVREIHDGVAGGTSGSDEDPAESEAAVLLGQLSSDVRTGAESALYVPSNGPRIRPKAPMRQYNVGSPFERIAIDIAGPFPVSDHGINTSLWQWTLQLSLTIKETGTSIFILFLMAYRSAVHESTGQTPASIIMGRELRLPCDLKFGIPPGQDTAGEGLRQQTSAENGRHPRTSPYKIVKRINDLVYRIHKPPEETKGRPFQQVGPYAGNHDQVRTLKPPEDDMTFEKFMSLYSNGQKVLHGVTREESRDLFEVPADYALAHCVAEDLRMSRGIAVVFSKKFGQLQTLREQNPEVGGVLQLKKGQRNIYYLVTKRHSQDKPSYEDVWKSLTKLRDTMVDQNLADLAIPKLSCGIDGLDWRVIRSMLEAIFRSSGIRILVCCNPLPRPIMKTVECYFHRTSRCRYGESCRYRHTPRMKFRDEMSLRRGQCNEPRPDLSPRATAMRSSPEMFENHPVRSAAEDNGQ
ncbi:hypothetical protein JTB14_020889 [Gonioctena quinquepunctata]|nr:hypothetical protein JTB14_020889 [Gonioctena quinquepunctata]